ncbi:hypothetical protein BDQ17DRAFT_1333614 [Cyathus striatus]|nr:hypothetical protein BDQ17DRAFT_1333614 [Cyathus striatus]
MKEGTWSMYQISFLNSLDSDIEGGMVAWCTKCGHGTCLIPTGTLAGVQFTHSPAYISIIGFINQMKINLSAGIWEGRWIFMGLIWLSNGTMCAYNVPNNAQSRTFKLCLADNQDFPGVCTENGQEDIYAACGRVLGALECWYYWEFGEYYWWGWSEFCQGTKALATHAYVDVAQKSWGRLSTGEGSPVTPSSDPHSMTCRNMSGSQIETTVYQFTGLRP